jgi:uncharacterized protein (DUF2141 family)
MKTMLIATAALALAGLAGGANAAPVHVTLKGVQPRGGNILVELQTRQQYTQFPFAAGTVIDGGSKGTVEFDLDVEPGTYAGSVLHDANSNMRLDSNPAGVPLEGVSSSNVLPTAGGRASFDEAAFDVGPKGATVTMVMRYPN